VGVTDRRLWKLQSGIRNEWPKCSVPIRIRWLGREAEDPSRRCEVCGDKPMIVDWAAWGGGARRKAKK
jgi:hypothetical protein